MNKKFYISDLHLNHKNALSFDDRPFSDTQNMIDAIIENWNNVVTKYDNVYILGDMFWRNEGAAEILAQLNGDKFLILGNHDNPNLDMKKHFVWVKDYAEIKDNGRDVILCHYPMAHWKNADYGSFHLYGHIHKGRDSRPFDEYKQFMLQRNFPYNCYNVGCMLDYMSYAPKTLDEIINANR
jgi:calcineurin-like phosphoesterase family protein